MMHKHMHARAHAHTRARIQTHTGKGGPFQASQASLWHQFITYEKSNPQVRSIAMPRQICLLPHRKLVPVV